MMEQIVFLPSGFLVEETDDHSLLELKENPYDFLYHQAFLDEEPFNETPAFTFLVKIAHQLIDDIKKDGEIEISRRFKPPSVTTLQQLLNESPFVIGSEFVDQAWINDIYQQLGEVFNREVANTTESIAAYLQAKNKTISIAGRVYFHLVESKHGEFPFAFMATYATGEKEKVTHLPLKNALEEFKEHNDILALLGAVGKVVKQSAFISELVESGELFHPLQLSADEAYIFLREIELYEKCGVTCRIPNFWKRETKRRVKLSIGSDQPSKVGLDSLLSCRPEMYIGDEQYSEEEILALLKRTEGLAFLKGKWIEINHEKLQELLSSFEAAQGMEVTLLDALRLDSKMLPNQKINQIEIDSGEWFASIQHRLLNPASLKEVKLNQSFKAELRPYQQTGYNWLNFMAKNQFGALLADDMGLGKTVQVLALLNKIKKEKRKTLLVVPASLMDNWRKEAEKFSPTLTLQILTSKHNHFDPHNEDANVDLFITTYGMVAKIEGLIGTQFDWLILDEAQAIKNLGTAQTKNIKKVMATHKLALTGTPIENNLADLWSIFDFLNKGLLGTRREFTSFIKKANDYGKIRQLISPFILRRLKTDKSIISDLPDKIETREYISLTKKQITLYKALQNEIAKTIEESDGIERRGLILSAIMKFKQICNHPDQYLGNQRFEATNSGKFEALKTICETIREKRERVLIFTQFKEMCQPLDDLLAEIFGMRGLVLHGGTRVKKRGEFVDQFNRRDIYTPYMVLSLKAGGIGLNLTAANHVIHFDRWWNPAIENQATDRAFRIGQEKNVMVYKFVTSGTIEEKINEMLLDKSKLSEEIITETSGEHWLTEMSNTELRQLFTLEAE